MLWNVWDIFTWSMNFSTSYACHGNFANPNKACLITSIGVPSSHMYLFGAIISKQEIKKKKMRRTLREWWQWRHAMSELAFRDLQLLLSIQEIHPWSLSVDVPLFSTGISASYQGMTVVLITLNWDCFSSSNFAWNAVAALETMVIPTLF